MENFEYFQIKDNFCNKTIFANNYKEIELFKKLYKGNRRIRNICKGNSVIYLNATFMELFFDIDDIEYIKTYKIRNNGTLYMITKCWIRYRMLDGILLEFRALI